MLFFSWTRVVKGAWVLTMLCALFPTQASASNQTKGSDILAEKGWPAQASAQWQQAIAHTSALPVAPIHWVAGDAATLKSMLLGAMARQYPGDTLRYMTQAFSDIGLLEEHVDLKDAALRLYEEQVIGFFDPHRRAMAIMTSAPKSAQEQVLRHELVHAQQDAFAPLQPMIDAASTDDDRALALQAVIEGQAVVVSSSAALSAMSSPRATAVDASVGTALKDAGIDISDDELQSLMGTQADLSALSESAATLLAGAESVTSASIPMAQDKDRPLYLQAQLLFPYQQGAQFIATLQKGSTLPAVIKETFTRPPQTTREVLHPELYRAGYTPERLALANLTALAQHRVLYATTIGELNMRTLLGGAANEVAALLRSDRLLLLAGPNDGLVTAWLTQWQDEKAATQFVTALRSKWRQKRRAVGSDRFQRESRLDALWQRHAGVAWISEPLGDPSPVEAVLRGELEKRNP